MNLLLSDNNKLIQIDSDKIIDKEKYVLEGHYALLIEEFNKKKLYIRVQKIDTPVWELVTDLKIDELLTTHSDLCLYQGKSLTELDISFFKDLNRCVYSEWYKSCIPITINNLYNEGKSFKYDLSFIDKDLVERRNLNTILSNQKYNLETYILDLDLFNHRNKR